MIGYLRERVVPTSVGLADCEIAMGVHSHKVFQRPRRRAALVGGHSIQRTIRIDMPLHLFYERARP